ncbi:hypothetical protein HY095_03320 [Candidatus Micrarchaeota archaeon]|nr:hypothetical protein [Candidatus Micrarchaeota archaeon]
MGVRRELKGFWTIYRRAHFARAGWRSAGWRLFLSVALVGVLLSLNEFISRKLLAQFAADPAQFLDLDFVQAKIAYWMAVGTVLGIVAAAAMYEGEFIIGLYRHLKHAEREAMGKISAELQRRHAAALKARKARRRSR